MVTAMAFLYFAEEQPICLAETGLGGRLDATNVISPEVCVITNMGFDHQEFLGSTLSSIARESGNHKAWRPGGNRRAPAVAQGILKTTCMNKYAPLYRFKSDFRVRRKSKGSFHYRGIKRQLPSLSLNLRGPHQVGNAALALATLEVLEQKRLISLLHGSSSMQCAK